MLVRDTNGSEAPSHIFPADIHTRANFPRVLQQYLPRLRERDASRGPLKIEGLRGPGAMTPNSAPACAHPNRLASRQITARTAAADPPSYHWFAPVLPGVRQSYYG